MRLPAEIVEPQREAASDPDASLTHPGIIRQGSPIFPQRNPPTGLHVGFDLGANKPCRISVCENRQSKKSGPCNRPGCWLQILNYKFLTIELTPSFCEGNFFLRRKFHFSAGSGENGCGNLNVENNITLPDESAGGIDSSCRFFVL
jgi:hypothetical protein